MKVKDIAKHYSMQNKGNFIVDVTTGASAGLHTFGKEAVKEMLEDNAPIMNRTVGLIYARGDDLIVTAYTK